MSYTTIMVDVELKHTLDLLKEHKSESYGEVVRKLATHFVEEKRMLEFAFAAQRKKMKELWDNDADKIWE